MARIFHWFFYAKDGSHVRLRRPPRVSERVHFRTKDVYTSVITFLALWTCLKLCLETKCQPTQFRFLKQTNRRKLPLHLFQYASLFSPSFLLFDFQCSSLKFLLKVKLHYYETYIIIFYTKCYNIKSYSNQLKHYIWIDQNSNIKI